MQAWCFTLVLEIESDYPQVATLPFNATKSPIIAELIDNCLIHLTPNMLSVTQVPLWPRFSRFNFIPVVANNTFLFAADFHPGIWTKAYHSVFLLGLLLQLHHPPGFSEFHICFGPRITQIRAIEMFS